MNDSDAFRSFIQQADHSLTDGFLPHDLSRGGEYGWITNMINCIISAGELHYAVMCNDKPVGCINVERFPQSYSRAGILRLMVLPQYYSLGIGTEAVRLIFDDAFDVHERNHHPEPYFNSLVARVVGDNPAAERVLTKNGFAYRGTQRRAVRSDDTFFDVRVFDITYDDYIRNRTQAPASHD